ncbi:MAG TPA: hypothetical protein VI796_04125 [Candidatus Thermoplasmatota archaeon]|nr:hypothetical protein [Candidatus Thermoplasmatota archaeon]
MSPLPQRTPTDLVAVREGCKEDFLKRHAKGKGRAREVWASLVAKAPQLQADTSFGPIFSPPRLPAFLKHVWPLRVVKGLPHAFRGVYTVVRNDEDGIVVRIEWVGDHGEYEALFGYA